ncbi:MAG: pentapeptide repeat-containing protein [Pirellulales bacterium]
MAPRGITPGRRVNLNSNDLSGWDFSGQDLKGTSFVSSTLGGTNLTDAIVAGADFSDTVSGGFTKEQLYSTASYKRKDLRGVQLAFHDLSGWNFRSQNLADALLWVAVFIDADFSFADLRGAEIGQSGGWDSEGRENMIWPDGRIEGLELGPDALLVVRDHRIGVTVRDAMDLAESGTLLLAGAGILAMIGYQRRLA